MDEELKKRIIEYADNEGIEHSIKTIITFEGVSYIMCINKDMFIPITISAEYY